MSIMNDHDPVPERDEAATGNASEPTEREDRQGLDEPSSISAACEPSRDLPIHEIVAPIADSLFPGIGARFTQGQWWFFNTGHWRTVTEQQARLAIEGWLAEKVNYTKREWRIKLNFFNDDQWFVHFSRNGPSCGPFPSKLHALVAAYQKIDIKGVE